MNYFICR